MPFSIPGGIDGVYVYDYSALSRFFREPFITFSSPVIRKDGSTALAEYPVGRLWAADRPSPDDLIRELEKPVQLYPSDQPRLVSSGGPASRCEWGELG
jgi:hypothetical protein